MENNNIPVWEWEDAVNFIAERCDVDREVIEEILELEFEYERSIGIIEDEDVEESIDVIQHFILPHILNPLVKMIYAPS